MPNSEKRLRRIASARADFLERGDAADPGVPTLVTASWQRSRAAGVDAARWEAQVIADFDPGSRLARCAEPVLTQLREDTAEVAVVIALTDHKARLVQRRDTSRRVGRLLDRVDFAPGYTYAEGAVGTNGIGTVIESGRSVSIIGPEHYSEQLQSFACTGSPIIDALTGRVAGILGLSTLAETWNPLMHTLAESAAKDISRNLLLDRSQAQQALFETYLQATARATRQAVFAFSETTSMLNAAAEGLFSGEELRAIRQHASFVMTGRDHASDTVDLASGRRIRLRGTRILAGRQTAGLVVIVEVIDPTAPDSAGSVVTASPVGGGGPSTAAAPGTTPPDAGSAGSSGAIAFAIERLPDLGVAAPDPATRELLSDLRRPYVPIADGSTPAWLRAGEQLRTALTNREPTLVRGEPGSGRFTLVAEIFHATHPGGRSMTIAPAQLDGAIPFDLEVLLTTHQPTLCIVPDLDRVSAAGVALLDRLLPSLVASGARTLVAATLPDGRLDPALPFHALLGHFTTAVTVPPLRTRPEDLAPIVTRLLAQLAPNRRVRLSPQAERAIARYGWPGNVPQLREALDYALHRRPVGEIRTEDLPSYCHTSKSRPLTRLETAERDAITAALHECGGNRQAAARHLGLSRSSIYRKLHRYGITL